MTAKRFSNALGNIGESYIHEAVTYTPKRKKNTWVKWVSIAACLSLIVMGGILGNLFLSPDTPDIPDTPDNNILSYFTITAHAANGESTDLLPDGPISSFPGQQQENIFGVDMPLFHFDVKPSDLKSNEAVYQRFDISVSYNGTPVQDKDEHIMVGYLASAHTSQTYGYSIFGWFTEPTNVDITVTDKESREIVEIITVNVKYIADRQEYELKVTNLTTLFAEQRGAVHAHNHFLSYLMAQNGTNYPAWFGGCYIRGNMLYIKLVSPSEEEMRRISDAFAYYGDVIVYENAERSMADLQEYADRAAGELKQLGYEVTSWYVDSVTGNIVIAVLEKDLEAAAEWVATALQTDNAPEIVIEIGEYTDTGLENQVIEFCADPFLQNIALSWMYSINVKIVNDEIYLNEILYDQVSYVENVDLDFSGLSPGPYVTANVTEVLDKIRNQKGCYMLETQHESSCGQKIALYVIGDTYYFIRFFDNGNIMRIHSGSVQ